VVRTFNGCFWPIADLAQRTGCSQKLSGALPGEYPNVKPLQSARKTRSPQLADQEDSPVRLGNWMMSGNLARAQELMSSELMITGQFALVLVVFNDSRCARSSQARPRSCID
jgi:hypothetical protein